MSPRVRTVRVGGMAPILVAEHGKELRHDVALLLIDAHLFPGSSLTPTETHDQEGEGENERKKSPNVTPRV